MLADTQQSRYVHQQMNTYKPSSKAQACGAQVPSQTSTPPQLQQLRLAMAVPAPSTLVVRMVDGAKPQPPQTFKPADFLKRADWYQEHLQARCRARALRVMSVAGYLPSTIPGSVMADQLMRSAMPRPNSKNSSGSGSCQHHQSTARTGAPAFLPAPGPGCHLIAFLARWRFGRSCRQECRRSAPTAPTRMSALHTVCHSQLSRKFWLDCGPGFWCAGATS